MLKVILSLWGFVLILTAQAQIPSVTLTPDLEAAITKAVDQYFQRSKSLADLSEPAQTHVRAAILRYFYFLQIDPRTEYGQTRLTETLSRLMGSSLQFILCDDLSNWSCLENDLKQPRLSYRQNQSPVEAIPAGDHLDMETFYTKRWSMRLRDEDMSQAGPTVAQILAQKIRQFADKKLWLAIYGIDDNQPGGSLNEMFSALLERVQQNIDTRAVIDISSESGANGRVRDYDVDMVNGQPVIVPLKQPLIMSYQEPTYDNGYWLFGQIPWQPELLRLGEELKALYIDPKQMFARAFDGQEKSTTQSDVFWLMGINSQSRDVVLDARRQPFQYKGSLDLILAMNKDIQSEDESRARVEFPTDRLMHNKFMVMQDQYDQKYVWTGTANIARTCMGCENNSNVSVFIKNNAIAEAFEAEFYEMFFDINPEAPLLTGRFHNQKAPNTPRYFQFNDGTEVKVHFSPTDDGEHRAILPMLLSVKPHDIIRISMFGGGGIELTRALQWAVAIGADVRIVFDRATGSGGGIQRKNIAKTLFRGGSWLKDTYANLLAYWSNVPAETRSLYEENAPDSLHNPYGDKGSLEVRTSTWPGFNHHKSATLTRYDEDGSQRVEYFIVGSQNWAEAGNDDNDENMITIRHPTASLPWGEEFNREFDERLWPLYEKRTNVPDCN